MTVSVVMRLCEVYKLFAKKVSPVNVIYRYCKHRISEDTDTFSFFKKIILLKLYLGKGISLQW